MSGGYFFAVNKGTQGAPHIFKHGLWPKDEPGVVTRDLRVWKDNVVVLGAPDCGSIFFQNKLTLILSGDNQDQFA